MASLSDVNQLSNQPIRKKKKKKQKKKEEEEKEELESSV